MAVVQIRCLHLLQRLLVSPGAQRARIQIRHSESENLSTDDIHRLTILGLLVELHPQITVHRDGIRTRMPRIQRHRPGHSAQVGIAVYRRHNATIAIVVVQYHLQQIDVGDWLELKVEHPEPAVSVLIKGKAIQVLINLDALLISGKEFLRLIERPRKLGSVVFHGMHRFARFRRYVIVGTLLIDSYALHTVWRLDIIPSQNVPESEIVFRRNGITGDVMLVGRAVRCARYPSGIIAANIECRRLGVTQDAEKLLVFLIPTEEPFCLPVIYHVIFQLIIPIYIELQVDGRHIHGNIFSALVQVEHRLSLATGKEDAQQCDAAQRVSPDESQISVIPVNPVIPHTPSLSFPCCGSLRPSCGCGDRAGRS